MLRKTTHLKASRFNLIAKTTKPIFIFCYLSKTRFSKSEKW
ncbi:hypothetical protein MY9_2603 [Bacillus sp. JS]|nr:hypothetical protein MY9_2603 [Bacillus sp. JS]